MALILKTENLSHRYSSTWAARDINIELNGPGITGLLGSNGAGKSTTMNIICGVLNQTEGKVWINGVDLLKNPVEAKKHIGFLPQIAPLYTDLSIDEYLTYCAQLRLIPKNKIKTAVEEVKERCGLGSMSSRLIRNLSGGYKQRVGIAQAIIHKPAFVVMDEPTNGLDPNQLIEARKLIRQIAEDHTVLLSSHILSEIQLLCKNIIMIESGRIVFNDSMDAFDNYTQPSSILMRMENPPGIAALLDIPGVSQVDFLTEKQARLSVEGDAQELAEELTRISIQQGWRLREISFEKSLLDDTFKQLSRQS